MPNIALNKVLPEKPTSMQTDAQASDPRPDSLLIVGVVRNCAGHLREDVHRLREALSDTNSLQWLLIESDSDDETVSLLEELSSEVDQFQYRTLGSLREKLPLRTQRIAHCRNVYLNELHQSTTYDDIQLVVVSDFDGVNKLLTREAILSCWQRNDWDVCTANQNGPYYDIWALRHPAWGPNDCWMQSEFLMRYRGDTDSNDIRFAAVYSRMITIPANSEWIEVDSAFGGLAIYKREALSQSKYHGLTSTGEEICEHVPFHQGLREHGCRIFINPKLINTSANEHTEPALQRKLLSVQMKKVLRQFKKRQLDDFREFARSVLGQKGYSMLKAMVRRGQ